ncbi:MAG: hypothetical protein N5P05_000822 [Chroococcopsis gigantea SAG 12.99]|jgi:hypothetical protein|nr:CGLD27 family protein [Chlorogloea purpurea SAG 13.99]MDV2999216.1 hypothetical protein [Chroococcopsis gigantea SAG 12.99]
MKESPVSFCPVPEEQQPVNEYEQLKDSWFFSWPTLEPWAYGKKLAWVWGWSWLLVGPIVAASFPIKKHPLEFILWGLIGTLLSVGLVLARLYLGWNYIKDRLNADKVFYEESGWYDGQTWTKTPGVLTRDRLIVAYQIVPLLDRLGKTALIVITVIISSGLLWLLITH